MQRKAALMDKFQKNYEKKRMRKDKNYVPRTEYNASDKLVKKAKLDDELMRDYSTAFD